MTITTVSIAVVGLAIFWYLEGATNGPVSSKNGVFETTNCSENWLHLAGGYNLGKARVELGYCYQTLIRNRK
ncbi:hypothetical protein, partial [Undibacterium sp.]|uniref:hypothetical protein n=1 Tax=Undibacterium sp. TaxID=1914977 RepID=UPI00374DF28E